MTLRMMLLFALLGTNACGTTQTPPRPDTSVVASDTASVDGPVWETLFASGFEDPDPIREGWSRIVEQTPADQPPSRVVQTGERTHSGKGAMKFYAGKRGLNPRIRGDQSFEAKAEVVKRDLFLKEGELVRIEGWYWLPPDEDHHGRVLMDLECGNKECGYAGQLGLRLFLDNAAGYLTLRTNVKWRSRDRGITRRRGSRPVPTGTWFKLSWWIKLGQGRAGWTRIYVDDALLIAAQGSTLRPDGLGNLDHYTTLQVGLTANGGLSGTTIYVDDVRLDRCVAGCSAPSSRLAR